MRLRFCQLEIPPTHTHTFRYIGSMSSPVNLDFLKSIHDLPILFTTLSGCIFYVCIITNQLSSNLLQLFK